MYTEGKYTEEFRAGDVLEVEESITSKNKKYRLILSSKGILYLNKYGTAKSIWDSKNTSQGEGKPYECVMRNDGRLAINNLDESQAIWKSRFYNGVASITHPGAFIRVQDDGNMVLYDSQGKNVLWKTGTHEKH